jgi:hypothetical protein
MKCSLSVELVPSLQIQSSWPMWLELSRTGSTSFGAYVVGAFAKEEVAMFSQVAGGDYR